MKFFLISNPEKKTKKTSTDTECVPNARVSYYILRFSTSALLDATSVHKPVFLNLTLKSIPQVMHGSSSQSDEAAVWPSVGIVYTVESIYSTHAMF